MQIIQQKDFILYLALIQTDFLTLTGTEDNEMVGHRIHCFVRIDIFFLLQLSQLLDLIGPNLMNF